MTPQDIIAQPTDQDFRECLLKMPVGVGIALPVAAYVRSIFCERMHQSERDNIGPRNFARTVLIFRTAAEFPAQGKESFEIAQELSHSVEASEPDFDVNEFMQQVREKLNA